MAHMINTLTLVPAANNLIQTLSAPDAPMSPNGYPFLSKVAMEKRASSIVKRGEALLDVLKVFFLRPLPEPVNDLAPSKVNTGWEAISWDKVKDPELPEHTPATETFAKAALHTSDPCVAMRAIRKPNTAFITDVILHPRFQHEWYEYNKHISGKVAAQTAMDPHTKKFLSREGQSQWFVEMALDAMVDPSNRIKAMIQAGKIQGYYSEKIQLLHENAPQLTQNVQQNIMIGTDLANKFRLFLQDKINAGELPAPDSTTTDAIDIQDTLEVETIEEAEVLPELPEFMR